MLDIDICLCGNKDKCPKKNTCRRAQNFGPGIYTISYFYKEGKDCKYYWKIKENKE